MSSYLPTTEKKIDALIVYGSFAPGCDEHEWIEDIADEFVEGSIKANAGAATLDWIFDDTGEEQAAWIAIFDETIDITDDELTRWDEEYEERWEALDTAYGDEFARKNIRFRFPNGDERDGWVYYSAQAVPESVHKDSADIPIKEVWTQFVAKQRDCYDHEFEYEFMEMEVDQIESWFDRLPNSAGFIKRFTAYKEGSIKPFVRETSKGYAQLNNELFDIVRKHNEQLLQAMLKHDPKKYLPLKERVENLSYEFVHVPADDDNSENADDEGYETNEETAIDNELQTRLIEADCDLWEEFINIPEISKMPYHWLGALHEACDNACNHRLHICSWLVQNWYEDHPTLEHAYLLKISKIRSCVIDNVCYVFRGD